MTRLLRRDEVEELAQDPMAAKAQADDLALTCLTLSQFCGDVWPSAAPADSALTSDPTPNDEWWECDCPQPFGKRGYWRRNQRQCPRCKAFRPDLRGTPSGVTSEPTDWTPHIDAINEGMREFGDESIEADLFREVIAFLSRSETPAEVPTQSKAEPLWRPLREGEVWPVRYVEGHRICIQRWAGTDDISRITEIHDDGTISHLRVGRGFFSLAGNDYRIDEFEQLPVEQWNPAAVLQRSGPAEGPKDLPTREGQCTAIVPKKWFADEHRCQFQAKDGSDRCGQHQKLSVVVTPQSEAENKATTADALKRVALILDGVRYVRADDDLDEDAAVLQRAPQQEKK